MLTKVAGVLLLPPGLLVLLAAVGLVLVLFRLRRSGLVLVIAAVAALGVLSVPVVGMALLRSVERYPPLDLKHRDPTVGAIVVLGGGLYANAPEYGGEDVVSGAELERLQYAVWLHRKTGLPILVAGGSVFGHETPEAIIIARCLKENFGVKPRWLDTRSRNTLENARNSAALLAKAGIRHIYLVTHAWHIYRATLAFRAAGLDVTPAPTVFVTHGEADRTILGYLPNIGGLNMSYIALHEYLGRLWYQITD